MDGNHSPDDISWLTDRHGMVRIEWFEKSGYIYDEHTDI